MPATPDPKVAAPGSPGEPRLVNQSVFRPRPDCQKLAMPEIVSEVDRVVPANQIGHSNLIEGFPPSPKLLERMGAGAGQSQSEEHLA